MLETAYIISFFGALLRLAGVLAFGVVSGWFAMYAIDQHKERWELLLGVFLGLLLFIGWFARAISAGALGVYLLGLSGGLLVWGILRLQDKQPKEEKKKSDK